MLAFATPSVGNHIQGLEALGVPRARVGKRPTARAITTVTIPQARRPHAGNQNEGTAAAGGLALEHGARDLSATHRCERLRHAQPSPSGRYNHGPQKRCSTLSSPRHEPPHDRPIPHTCSPCGPVNVTVPAQENRRIHNDHGANTSSQKSLEAIRREARTGRPQGRRGSAAQSSSQPAVARIHRTCHSYATTALTVTRLVFL